MNKSPKIIQDCHSILLWLIPKLDKFPRHRRFTLGERIETGLLDVLEWLITANYKNNNKTELAQANHKLAVIRHLWRLCYELEVIPIKQYEHGSKLLLEIGAQIGGWMKHEKK